MAGAPIIKIEGLSKKFRVYRERQDSLKSLLSFKRNIAEDFWVLKSIDLEVYQGETIALIGQNGCGKSTILKIAAGILFPTEGSITVLGKISALLELGAGFHPDLSGRENIYLNGSILGIKRCDIDTKIDKIIDFAELREFIDTPIKNYSSGMLTRLGFAVAVHSDPNVLLLDEILAVGDESFQRKCADTIFEMKQNGVTILLVTHDMTAVSSLCDKAAWLKNGEIAAAGDAIEIVNKYIGSVNDSDEAGLAGRVSEEQTGLGARWGSGEAILEKVEFIRVDGKPHVSFKTGDSFTARLSYNAAKRIDKPVFGVAISRADGIQVNGPNTKMYNQVPDKIEGQGYVDYLIPSLPLTPGTYLFTAAIYDYNCLHPYDHQDKKFIFKVVPGDEPEKAGLVRIENSWSFGK